jgi:hypothetical protein
MKKKAEEIQKEWEEKVESGEECEAFPEAFPSWEVWKNKEFQKFLETLGECGLAVKSVVEECGGKIPTF